MGAGPAACGGCGANAGMLAVARSLPTPTGVSAVWIERNAVDTGLAAGSFDVVVCQQGLQFFPDKAAALREMHRVLVPGGRLALSVWCTSGVYNSAVGAALGQHVGSDVAARFCASRHVPPGDELVRLAVAAGLRDVQLQVQRMIARLPPPAEFVPAHLAATPVASAVRAMNSPARAALGRTVARLLAAYNDDDGLAFPEEVNVVTASA